MTAIKNVYSLASSSSSFTLAGKNYLLRRSRWDTIIIIFVYVCIIFFYADPLLLLLRCAAIQ